LALPIRQLGFKWNISLLLEVRKVLVGAAVLAE
jgi:hypothetical protein